MFVELHARSAFSFLEAAALPEALAERAARLEHARHRAAGRRRRLRRAPALSRLQPARPLGAGGRGGHAGRRQPAAAAGGGSRGVSEPLPPADPREDAGAEGRGRRHVRGAGRVLERPRLPDRWRPRPGGGRAGRARARPPARVPRAARRHLRPLQRLRRAAAPPEPPPGGAQRVAARRWPRASGWPRSPPTSLCSSPARIARCSTCSPASASTPRSRPRAGCSRATASTSEGAGGWSGSSRTAPRRWPIPASWRCASASP